MELNKTYTFRVTIGEKLLTFTNSKVIAIDDMFVTILDKYNNKVAFNKKNIDSYEEVRE
jgi:hypothetical protein